MITLSIEENLITDLRDSNIQLPTQAFNSIPYDIDIQNSNVQYLDNTSIRNKFVFIVDDTNTVIAIYGWNKFLYNPKKLKVLDIGNYDVWEVVNNKGSVLPKRNERELSRKGYTDLSTGDNKYNKPPKSTRYVLDKDWNPEVNREYYVKLLHQNKLGMYAQQLDYAYTIMEDLISHRRAEQTVGKRGVYTNWVKKLASSIETAETLMDALDKNFNPDIPKLKRSLKSLETVTKQAYDFIKYEDDAIATFGHTKKREPVRIER